MIQNSKSHQRDNDNILCPFELVRTYLRWRGDYTEEDENFFVFADKTNVMPVHVRNLLRDCLKSLSLEPSLYDTHSFHIGRTGDLVREEFSVEEIRLAGRWRSGAVYKYLRDI